MESDSIKIKIEIENEQELHAKLNHIEDRLFDIKRAADAMGKSVREAFDRTKGEK